MDIKEYMQDVGRWFLTSGLQIMFILVLMLIAVKVGDYLSKKLIGLYSKRHEDIESQKRSETISNLIRYSLNVVVFTVSFLMILGEVGIDIGPIIAAAGVLGVAIGFGAKKLVEDIISGFFIFLEDQIRVGDVVDIAGKSGLVEKVTLRMIILRDLSGNVHFVRNGDIGVVTNMTKEYSRYVFDIGVAYKENVDQVIDLIKKVDADLRSDSQFKNNILEPIEILGLDSFADSAVVIKARTKTKPIKQWEVAREFKKRLKYIFDEEGIEIPYPHRTLYFGMDKEGNAPALNFKNLSAEDSKVKC